MITDLLTSVGLFILAITNLLALLIALIEASRKYDKFRHGYELVLASGYFLLMLAELWLILTGFNRGASSWLIGQSLGLIVLATGFMQYQKVVQAERVSAQFDPQAPRSPQPNKATKKHQSGLASLVGSNQEEPPKQESENLVQDIQTTSTVPAVETVKSVHHQAPTAKPKLTSTTNMSDKPEPTVISSTEELSPPSTTKKATINLSQLKRKSERPKGRKKRQALLNDLFPIPEPAATDHPPLPSATVDKSDHRLPSELPIGLMGYSFTSGQSLVSTTAPVVSWLAASSILASLFSLRDRKGMAWLIAGFSLINLSTLIQGLSVYLELPWWDNPWLSAISLTVSYLLIACGSYQRIRGKVTKHFLQIVIWLYLMIMATTIGLSLTIVESAASLTLLTYFVVGILTLILPIIHAMAFDHPQLNPETAHE